ncbi:hypothetical protein LJR296_003353 [Cupriavidus necator]|uniref:hypothetical protein n=1 Tax=Cupriavidus necator TaxID=106590 RepID=UPI003ECDC2DE
MTVVEATRLSRYPSRGALVLALAATSTALCLSTLAGWQRGGWLVERLAWVAIGAVLVLSAHLLPALGQAAQPAVRRVGGLLWAACMLATGYGHATFFLWSQHHAGEARAAAMASLAPTGAATKVPEPVTVASRPLSALAAERAKVVTALAATQARRCAGDCAALQAKRAGLAATLEALDVEADEVRRWQTAEDRRFEVARRETVRRDEARHDPFMTVLAAWLDVTPADVEFLGALVLAGALEGVACYGWFLALAARLPPVTGPVTDSHAAPTADGPSLANPVTDDHGTVMQPVTATASPSHAESDAEQTRLHRAVAAGQLRPTVAEIRCHLGCSQAKASALRRLLVT